MASESACPRETDRRSFGTGKRDIRARWCSSVRVILRGHLDLNELGTKERDACPSMNPSTPVLPKEWRIPDGERMQKDAHPARLLRVIALPLTRLSQQAGTATANAGGGDHAQAAIGFSTPLMGRKRLPYRTPECPIRLEREICSGKTTCFEGGGGGRWAIP
jgi:hypothetical protein